MANIGRLVVFGCGGLLGLVVLIVIIAAIVGGGGDETSEGPPSSESAQGGGGEQEEPTAQVGETLAVGDVAWTVTGARRADTLQDPFGKGATEGNFVIVDVTFQNNSDRSKTLDTHSMSLIDSEGRESEADPEQFRYIKTEQKLFLEQVNPGVAKEGQAIYTVAEGASGFRLYVGDAEPFSQEAGYIELGFQAGWLMLASGPEAVAEILEDNAWWNRLIAEEDEELAAEGVEMPTFADFELVKKIAAL